MNTNTDKNIIRNETAHSINGASGRLFTLCRPPAPWKAGTFANQTWVSEARPIEGYGTNGMIRVNIRFDDNCKNGHNTFAITADVRTLESRRIKDIAAGGCLHEDIEQIFPELAHLIQWHSCSTDGPMHYVENTLYHASDRDHNGLAAGDACAWDNVVYFGNSPVSHKIKTELKKFVESRAGTGDFQVVAIAAENKPGGYQFDPKHTFVGFGTKWYECPFDSLHEANEWAAGFNAGEYRIEAIPSKFSKGKTRDFDSARKCSVWPDATDDQLCAPRDILESALMARLSALLAKMRDDIEGAGFMWQCPVA